MNEDVDQDVLWDQVGAPEPWIRVWSTEYGRHYYFNTDTEESIWERLSEWGPLSTPGSSRRTSCGEDTATGADSDQDEDTVWMSGGWIKVFDAEYDRHYYFHVTDENATWDRPDEYASEDECGTLTASDSAPGTAASSDAAPSAQNQRTGARTASISMGVRAPGAPAQTRQQRAESAPVIAAGPASTSTFTSAIISVIPEEPDDSEGPAAGSPALPTAAPSDGSNLDISLLPLPPPVRNPPRVLSHAVASGSANLRWWFRPPPGSTFQVPPAQPEPAIVRRGWVQRAKAWDDGTLHSKPVWKRRYFTLADRVVHSCKSDKPGAAAPFGMQLYGAHLALITAAAPAKSIVDWLDLDGYAEGVYPANGKPGASNAHRVAKPKLAQQSSIRARAFTSNAELSPVQQELSSMLQVLGCNMLPDKPHCFAVLGAAGEALMFVACESATDAEGWLLAMIQAGATLHSTDTWTTMTKRAIA